MKLARAGGLEARLCLASGLPIRSPGGVDRQNGLIAPLSPRAVDGARGARVELLVLFGAGDEGGASLREDVEVSAVHLTGVEQGKGTGFQPPFVQQVGVVDLPAGHINTGRNAAAHVPQGVELDRTLAAAKLAPESKRQTGCSGRMSVLPEVLYGLHGHWPHGRALRGPVVSYSFPGGWQMDWIVWLPKRLSVDTIRPAKEGEVSAPG